MHVSMSEMPLPAAPFQMVSVDLIGPFPTSPRGSKYLLTVIDHFSGWGEAYPLPDKTNNSVWRAIANEFIPRHSVPEILLSDNGKEFTAHAFTQYLQGLGCEHRRTTPVHPRANGRVERFNRTFKEMLAKLVNNYALDWEDRVSDVLMAHRNSVSSVTKYTPFFLVYGRRSRTPMTKLLPPPNENNKFGNRLDDLADAFRQARENTSDSRKYNRERLAKRANAGPVDVGDSIMIKAEERLNLTSRHDPLWEVTRVRGPVVFLRHQLTGKTKRLNRSKITVVDPNILWDEVRVRPIRDPRKSAIPDINQPVPQFYKNRKSVQNQGNNEDRRERDKRRAALLDGDDGPVKGRNAPVAINNRDGDAFPLPEDAEPPPALYVPPSPVPGPSRAPPEPMDMAPPPRNPTSDRNMTSHENRQNQRFRDRPSRSEPYGRQGPRYKTVSYENHSFVNRKLPNWQPSPQPDPDSDEEMEIAAIMREGATFQQKPSYAEIVKRPASGHKLSSVSGHKMRPSGGLNSRPFGGRT